MNFDTWYLKSIQEAQDRYKQKEEQKLEAEAEQAFYEEYLEELASRNGNSYGEEDEDGISTLDTDCDTASKNVTHTADSTAKPKSSTQIRRTRAAKRCNVNPHLKPNDEEDNSWDVF